MNTKLIVVEEYKPYYNYKICVSGEIESIYVAISVS